jgi:hypothetical protein
MLLCVATNAAETLTDAGQYRPRRYDYRLSIVPKQVYHATNPNAVLTSAPSAGRLLEHESTSRIKQDPLVGSV